MECRGKAALQQVQGPRCGGARAGEGVSACAASLRLRTCEPCNHRPSTRSRLMPLLYQGGTRHPGRCLGIATPPPPNTSSSWKRPPMRRKAACDDLKGQTIHLEQIIGAFDERMSQLENEYAEKR